MPPIRVAVLQMASSGDKSKNLKKAESMVREGAEKGAEVAVLPELFNFLAGSTDRKAYEGNAEDENGETLDLMRDLSSETGVAIFAGTMAEREGEKIYNTAFVVSEGRILAKYRKNHLFNYGKIREGDVFEPGEGPTVIELCGMKFGITVCFDLRFPELFRAEALQGAEAIVNISAFLRETGKAHWSTLLRARAIENQAYIIAANQASEDPNNARYYGHSCIINPWGRCIRCAGYSECIIIGKIDPNEVQETRKRLPVLDSFRAY